MDTFIQGSKAGILDVVRLMPTLIGLMAAVGILRASGFLEFISEIIGNVTEQIGFQGHWFRIYDCENVFVLCSNGIIA